MLRFSQSESFSGKANKHWPRVRPFYVNPPPTHQTKSSNIFVMPRFKPMSRKTFRFGLELKYRWVGFSWWRWSQVAVMRFDNGKWKNAENFRQEFLRKSLRKFFECEWRKNQSFLKPDLNLFKNLLREILQTSKFDDLWMKPQNKRN